MKKIISMLILICQFAVSQKLKSEDAIKKIKVPEPKELSKYHFLAKAKFYGDSVVLRWSANDAVLWQMANNKGYNISRYEVLEGKIINRTPLSKSLKPWTLAQWKANCKPSDTTAAVIAQMLYGVNKDPKNPSGNGSMGAIMNQRNDIENRFFVVNMMAAWHPYHAKGLAMRLVDKTIKKDKRYIYVISAQIDSKQMVVDSAFVAVNTNQVDLQDKMVDIEAEAGDKKITLKWSKLLSEQSFTGFFYERSADNGKTFIKLNSKPFLQLGNKEKESEDFMMIKDSIPQNYKKYIYRIAGINHFGEKSLYSNTVHIMGIDLTAPSQAQNIVAEHIKGQQVKISWKKPIKESDFIGFVIGRSQNIKGPFEPLQKKFLGTYSTEFTDETAEPFGTNYYVVSAVDTAGNAAISLPAYVVMKDEAPPSEPKGLKAKIDSTGVVQISWNKNSEPDLEGYLVYAANAKDHVFTPLTTGFLMDEFFADSTSLQTLTKYKYYKIVAFDKARKASKFSEVLEVKKPDKVPPVPPVFNNYAVADSAATISWIPSTSTDVIKQILFRKEEGKTDYVEVKSFDQKIKSFIDPSVKPGVWYSYVIQAIDQTGLKSERSFPLKVKPYDSGIRPNVKQLNVSLSADKKSINLKWDNLSSKNYRVLIYRKKNNEQEQLISGINAPLTDFKDTINTTGSYAYATKIKYSDGSESLLSSFKSIKVE